MIKLPDPVIKWLTSQGCGEIVQRRAASGGCINHGEHLLTHSGCRYFLKTNSAAPAQMFLREAEGLAELASAGQPRIPAVLLVGEDFLLLEDLQPAAPREDYWERLGRELAALHRCTSDSFGFTHDNYIGSTVQPNLWQDDGFEFYAEQRLGFQARLAYKQGLLSSDDIQAVDHLANRLSQFVPAQPASLLHGDLWRGNVISDSKGSPAIIDPAVYYGWAEAELAMTALFGAFPERFYRAYDEIKPLEKDYRQRFDLYNLYHLLNHLNLFGSSYLSEVRGVLRAFS